MSYFLLIFSRMNRSLRMILIRSFLFAVTLLAMLALPGVSVLAADFPYDPTRAKQGLHENDQEALERLKRYWRDVEGRR